MKVLVTAGPTQEPIDPVRFIGNRSSGKMGYAVARAAVERGHDVRLISGPVPLAPPDGVEVLRVKTADEMLRAVRDHVTWCTVLIMAAAVADWRPVSVSRRKIKKHGDRMCLEMEPTTDILNALLPLKGGRLFVGFAAETENLLTNATDKLRRKGLDLIVANDVTRPGAGFEADTNEVVLLASDGTRVDLPLMAKIEVARRLVEWAERQPARAPSSAA